MDQEIIDAAWAEGLPEADGNCRFWRVGEGFWNGKGRAAPVTRITVQHDLPGLHCNLRRVCVWIGETMVAEAPLHSLAAVGYPVPEGDHNG